MLLKIYETYPIYQTQNPTVQSGYNESVAIIDDANDVIVHQGNWDLPSGIDGALPSFLGWGPQPAFLEEKDITTYLNLRQDGTDPRAVRVIDYTRNGRRQRACIEQLCYVCNDGGKTIEKVESYSGCRLSVI